MCVDQGNLSVMRWIAKILEVANSIGATKFNYTMWASEVCPAGDKATTKSVDELVKWLIDGMGPHSLEELQIEVEVEEDGEVNDSHPIYDKLLKLTTDSNYGWIFRYEVDGECFYLEYHELSHLWNLVTEEMDVCKIVLSNEQVVVVENMKDVALSPSTYHEWELTSANLESGEVSTPMALSGDNWLLPNGTLA